jgi:hypothetical protein
MREKTHDSSQKSRAAPDAPFLLWDFFVFIIFTLTFPRVTLEPPHLLYQTEEESLKTYNQIPHLNSTGHDHLAFREIVSHSIFSMSRMIDSQTTVPVG